MWAAHWGARREAPGAARLWESAFAAVIGRPAAWAGNPVRGGCRAGALGGPPASSKARQAETADLGGLDLPHKRFSDFLFFYHGLDVSEILNLNYLATSFSIERT